MKFLLISTVKLLCYDIRYNGLHNKIVRRDNYYLSPKLRPRLTWRVRFVILYSLKPCYATFTFIMFSIAQQFYLAAEQKIGGAETLKSI